MSLPAPTLPAETPTRKELGEHTTAPWKLRALAECPAKFYLGAVAKDPRRKESGFEAKVGTLLHHGIEQVAWMRTWLSLDNPPLTPDELLRGIDRPSDSKGVEAARRDQAALVEAKALAKKVAKNVDMQGLVVESFGAKMRPLVEEPWTLDVGEIPEAPGARVVVGGIWDFVRRAHGKLVITDWKKGGDIRSSDELRLDPAATLYAAAAHERWPKERVRVEHVFLTRGISVGLDWTPEVDEWARLAALEHARAVAAFTKAGEWPATPSVKACGFCSFRPTCQAFIERAAAPLGALDPALASDLEAGTLARHRAAETEKLAELRKQDLDASLGVALARAAEVGVDDLVVAGHRVRRASRTVPSFDGVWRSTIRRVWELTGIPPAEIEDAVLSFRVSALDDLLSLRGFDQAKRELVRRAVDETATERTSTWIEVKPVADPIPSIDVAEVLARGVRVALPPPRSEKKHEPKTTPGAQVAGPGPQAAPAQERSQKPLESKSHTEGAPEVRPVSQNAGAGGSPAGSPGVDRQEKPDGTACRASTAGQESPGSAGGPSMPPAGSPGSHAAGCSGELVVHVGHESRCSCGARAVFDLPPKDPTPTLVNLQAPVEHVDVKADTGFNAASLAKPNELKCPEVGCGFVAQNKRGLSGHARKHKKEG